MVAQNITIDGNVGRIGQLFAATPLSGGFSGALGETLSAEIAGVFYDTSVSGLTRSCGGSCLTDTGGGMGIDGALMPTYFTSRVNAPMSTWDFTIVWREEPGAYPSLRRIPAR